MTIPRVNPSRCVEHDVLHRSLTALINGIISRKAWGEIWIPPSTVTLASLSVPSQGEISPRVGATAVPAQRCIYILELNLATEDISSSRLATGNLRVDLQTAFNRRRQSLTEGISGV